MVTKYVLTEKRTFEDGTHKDVPILETYQMADIIKKLAELYGEANDVDT